MKGELFAIVVSEGFELISDIFEELVDDLPDRTCLLGFCKPDEGVFTHSVNDGDKNGATLVADDGVHFKITDPGLVFDDLRALVDAGLVFDGSPAIFLV